MTEPHRRQILSRRARDAAAIYSSDMMSALMGFISVIVVSRVLGPSDFGIFSIATAFMGISLTLSDFGLSSGAVRLASPQFKTNPEKYRQIIQTSLAARLAISTLVLVLGMSVSWIFSDLLIKEGDGHIPIVLAFIGGFASSLYAHVRVFLQTSRRFKALAATRIVTSGATLVVLLLLIAIDTLNPSVAIASYAIAPLATFTLLTAFSGGLGGLRPVSRGVYRDLIRFSKWIFLVTTISAVFMKLDVFFLGGSWTGHEVGIYSAAFTLTFPISQLAGSLTTVLLPDISCMKTKRDIREFIWSSLRYTIPLSAGLIVFAFTSLPDEILPWLFGAVYSAAVEPFRVLVVSATVVLMATPIYLVVYPIGAPRALAEGDAVKLVFFLTAYALLVPSEGIMGAAYGNVLAMSLGSVMSILIVLRALSKARDTFVEEVTSGPQC